MEIVRLVPGMEDQLAAFFEAIRPDEHVFHPHPLTREQAELICGYSGRDLYYAMLDDAGGIVGYGMLRGWDEGYDIPAIGLAIHPRVRGLGLAKPFMRWLADRARERGATRIRGRLLKTNVISRRMCEQVGYVFDVDDGDYLIGFASTASPLRAG